MTSNQHSMLKCNHENTPPATLQTPTVHSAGRGICRHRKSTCKHSRRPRSTPQSGRLPSYRQTDATWSHRDTPCPAKTSAGAGGELRESNTRHIKTKHTRQSKILPETKYNTKYGNNKNPDFGGNNGWSILL